MRRYGFLSAIAWIFLSVTLPASAAAGLEVVSSSPEMLQLRLETGELTWETRDPFADGVTRQLPHLDGFVTTGAPMAPMTPVHGTWIVVPPGTTPVLETASERWRALDGRELLRGPVPVMIPGPDGDSLGETYLRPGGEPRHGRALMTPEELAANAAKGATGAVLSLGEIVSWRGRRIAPLTVRPLQAGADARARRVLETGEWRIRFESDPGLDRTTGRRQVRDARFASRFLNGGLLSTLARETATTTGPVRSKTLPKALLAPEVRLPVTRTGPVAIQASTLINAGLLPSGIDETSLRLYQRRYMAEQDPPYVEIEVPILMLGDGDDFTGDDAFVFYGLRARDDGAFSLDGTDYPDCGDLDELYNPSDSDPVNNGNIYYLAAAEPEGEGWARMAETSLPAASGTPVASYRRVDYHEEDTHYSPHPATHDVDRNHWNAFKTGELLRDLDLVNPLADGDPARLRVGLVGNNDQLRSFEIGLYKDGADAALDTLQATYWGNEYDSGETIAAADLIDAQLHITNTVYIYLYGYLDWMEVSYDAAYAAVDDMLDFHAGAGVGTVDLEVTGFGEDEIVLLDVSDPRAPVHVVLAAANLIDAGGSTTLSLQVEQASPVARRFHALAGDPVGTLPTFPYYKASTVDVVEDPAAVVEAPDVLVVTHPSFRDEAERWAAYRAAHWPDDLAIRVVDVHAVYDWYSGGLKTPEAIKRLCSLMQARHGTWALQIFGDANENVKGLSDPLDLRDWVPTHLHNWERSQNASAMLPADKWFATSYDGDDYPVSTTVLPEMLVGRFPANSAEEAADMVDKVISYESATADWKKRAIFLADDAWSDSSESASLQDYNSSEEAFEDSEEASALAWESFAQPGEFGVGDSGFTAVRIYLTDDLEPLSPSHGESRVRSEFCDYCETYTLPRLLAAANQGATFLHFQGHGNNKLLAHEQVIEDRHGVPNWREDVSSFSNTGKPWVFVGMGCHIGTWALDGSAETGSDGHPSLAEKMLLRGNAGAVAAYASPGYEYLTTNKELVLIQFDRMTQSPPRGDISGEVGRSRWVLGDLLQAAEATLMAYWPLDTTVRLAVAQYALLGDALMIIDMGPPDVDVFLDWEAVEDGSELKAADESNELVFTVRAFDEAGVDRLVISDSEGADLSGLAIGGTPDGADSDQRAEWEVRLPIESRDYSVTFEVFDTADGADADAPFSLTVHLPVTVTLRYEDRIFVPGETELSVGEDWSFTGTAVTAAYLDTDVELDLLGQNVTLSDVSLTRADEHRIDLSFTAAASGGGMPSVVLLIDGYGTEIPLQDESASEATGIANLMVFPNPVHDEAHILFETGASPSPGRILIYTVAGDRVRNLPVRAAHFGWGGGQVRVPWDGRDDRGEALANGVYIYRVILDAPGGSLASGMQRLVVMK